MKKVFSLLAMITLVFALTACENDAASDDEQLYQALCEDCDDPGDGNSVCEDCDDPGDGDSVCEDCDDTGDGDSGSN